MFVRQLQSSSSEGKRVMKEGGGFVEVRSGGKYCGTDVRRLSVYSFPSCGSHFLSELGGGLSVKRGRDMSEA